jgi:predicted nucleotidyltransferase
MLVNAIAFEKLSEGAKPLEISGINLRAPSLENLFALKFHVLQQEIPHRGYKDLMDILALADCNAVDLRSDKIRELCEKFGNTKIYERLLAFKG